MQAFEPVLAMSRREISSTVGMELVVGWTKRSPGVLVAGFSPEGAAEDKKKSRSMNRDYTVRTWEQTSGG